MSQRDSIGRDVIVTDFQATVWKYFHEHGRHDLPWRITEADGSFDPYRILVSELMLQQTQVARVIPKYQEFIRRFPTVSSLAAADLGEVLRLWSGLGYNRRAKFLYQTAQTFVLSSTPGNGSNRQYPGHKGYPGQIADPGRSGKHDQFPQQISELVKLPGIGPNTAGAILAYAFNQPVVFVETNIRTVFIHHFFADNSADTVVDTLITASDTSIADADILKLVSVTLDHEHPREWYWALMDYGSYLKQTVGNVSRQSKMYTRQSAFHGSRRQIRGQIIRLLGERPRSINELRDQITDPRLSSVLDELVTERLIRRRGTNYLL